VLDQVADVERARGDERDDERKGDLQLAPSSRPRDAADESRPRSLFSAQRRSGHCYDVHETYSRASHRQAAAERCKNSSTRDALHRRSSPTPPSTGRRRKPNAPAIRRRRGGEAPRSVTEPARARLGEHGGTRTSES
jgi:hypothetical protein